MTEREPFAVYEISEDRLSANVLCGGRHVVGNYGNTNGMVFALAVCDAINAAFNKRLDEEIAKARKEWERGE